MNSNNPFPDPPPQFKNYPNTAAWVEAMRQYYSSTLTFMKTSFDEFRDAFIALENPTREQAAFYRKHEHLCRTVVGMSASELRAMERWLRHFGPTR
jgi:hypothetical protein